MKKYTFFNEQTGILETITVTATTLEDTKVISEGKIFCFFDISIENFCFVLFIDEMVLMTGFFYFRRKDGCFKNTKV